MAVNLIYYKRQFDDKGILLAVLILAIVSISPVVFSPFSTTGSGTTMDDPPVTGQSLASSSFGSPSDPILTGSGGYSLSPSTRFDVLENATSSLNAQEFLANGISKESVSTPSNWTTKSEGLNLAPYTKVQKIGNPYFNKTTAWSPYSLATGAGTIAQGFLPNSVAPQYVVSNFTYLAGGTASSLTGFKKGNYALWNSTTLIKPPSGAVGVQNGVLYQASAQASQNFNDFATNPNFNTEPNCPYGGVRGQYDSEVLNYESDTHDLLVDISPYAGVGGGNPSAAWWSTTNVPWVPDYAQLTISWSIDPSSTFTAANQYQVIARVNGIPINGLPVSKGGDLVSWNDSIPLFGNSSCLMLYNNSAYLNHPEITRTYDITNVLDYLTGNVEFDFGVWAADPGHQGVTNQIIARFFYLDLYIRTGNKYENARLTFDYKAINNNAIITSTQTLANSINKASMFIVFKAGSTSYPIRVLPFKSMIIDSPPYSNSAYIHVIFSIPQAFQTLLESSSLDFYIGFVFEQNSSDAWNFNLYLDNVYLYINYALSPAASRLQMQVDSSGVWQNVTTNNVNVNITGWTPGQPHSFAFNTSISTYASDYYLDINSTLLISFYHSGAAATTYNILTANSAQGTWNATFNNTASYNDLPGTSPSFDLTKYQIFFLNLPALDNRGSASRNWKMFAVYQPGGTNFTSGASTFNYTANPAQQSVQINNANYVGTWTVEASQPNYVTGSSFNNTIAYAGLPAFFTSDTMQFSFTVPDNVKCNYSVALLNVNGSPIPGYLSYHSSTGQTIVGTISLGSLPAAGGYYLSIVYNDSAQTNGTTLRCGSRIVPFYVLTNTMAGLVHPPASVDVGQIANFSAYFTTLVGNTSIAGASMAVYELSGSTYKYWGIPWSGSNQTGAITYNSSSHLYLIPLMTAGAPNGTYSLIFAFTKQYYRPQNVTWSLTVNATGTIQISIKNGAYSSNDSLWANNTPYVNDTVNSHVQLRLNDLISHLPILNGVVLAHIGTSGVYVQGLEVYKVSHLTSDEGLYNITLNTVGLNATTGSQVQTLYITCSASSYAVKGINITMTIKEIPTQVTLNSIPAVYAGGSITLLATMENTFTPGLPVPINFGRMAYFITNGSGTVMTGPLPLFANGVYTSTISLVGLSPGSYSVYTNGTAINCQSSDSGLVSLAVYAQVATQLSISVPSTIRILNQFQIQATLVFVGNGSAILGQSLNLNISISNVTLGLTITSFIVSGVTDGTGSFYYSYIISDLDQNLTFSVVATFAGSGSLKTSSASASETILGKIPIDMTLTPLQAQLRVGYPATFSLAITILDPSESNQSRPIFFTAVYDGQVLFPFLTEQLSTNVNGTCMYTIPELANGEANLTVYFEYFGSTTVAYNDSSLFSQILPKWAANFTAPLLPTTIHFGQVLAFDMNFSCQNSSVSLEGLPVVFDISYNTTYETYTLYVTASGTVFFNYDVPDSFSPAVLNVTISFLGSDQIANYTMNMSLPVASKVQVIITFVQQVSSQYMTGTQFFSVKVTDAQGNPLAGLEITYIFDGLQFYDTTNDEGISSVSIPLNVVGNDVNVTVQFAGLDQYASATVQSSIFNVVDDWVLFLNDLPFILIAVVIVVGFGISLKYGVVNPRRNRHRAYLKDMFGRLSDVENIQHIIVLSKDGVPMFSKSLSAVSIDSTLISGFLSAISTFGSEIGTKMKKQSVGGLEELSYNQFKIIIDDGIYVRVALLLLKHPSDALKVKLKKFIEYFEQIFARDVASFSGAVLPDTQITPLIEKIFEADLLYPHRVIEQKVPTYEHGLSKKSVLCQVLIAAQSPEFNWTFYIHDMVDLLKTKGIEEINSFEALRHLQEDKILVAINPRLNYLIEQFRPLMKNLTTDERTTILAMGSGAMDGMAILKYFNKSKIKQVATLETILTKLRALGLADKENHLTQSGDAVATLFRLLPDT